MSGQNRIIKAQQAKGKTPKGSALKDAMKSVNTKIASVNGKEKVC